MSERRDDTPERDESSPVNSEPPGSYYYDDATGYEVYDPAKDDDECKREPDHSKDEG